MTQQITSFDEGEPEPIYMQAKEGSMGTAETFFKYKFRVVVDGKV